MRRVVFVSVVLLMLGQAKAHETKTVPTADLRLRETEKTVIAIHAWKIRASLYIGEGTGFCLDLACRFIATNYHVAMITNPRKIKGTKVLMRYLATGPDDDGATENAGPMMGSMRYNFGRDLAIFELRYPLAGHHGIGFSQENLQLGQGVNIYAFPKEGINPMRKLLEFHGRFSGETGNGLLRFNYDLDGDKTIRPGASGGIVVDGKSQQIVGILNGIAKNGEAVATAVPVQSLIEFVSKVQPFLAQKLFPSAKNTPLLSADIHPKFVPLTGLELQHRTAESPAIKLLRSRAQALSEGMRNFAAVQNFAWGSGNKEPASLAAYEILVLNGEEQFREYPDGKKLLREIPPPPLNNWIRPAGEWSQLPLMVGTQLGLKIQQAPDAVVNGQHIKVFQYSGKIEDGVCRFETISDFGFFSVSKTETADCYGEAWTDEDTNILRMSEHYDLHGRSDVYSGVVTYGFLQPAGESPRVIPMTFFTQTRDDHRTDWCRGQFTNYRRFVTESRIIASN